MGYDMQEGTLVRWLKSEDDSVTLGELIAEVETDKAVVEIEATAAGTVLKLLVDEGTSVPVGEAIAVIGEPGEDIGGLQIDDKQESVLIKNVQVHPSKRQIIHLDLQRVIADQVIKVSIPLQFINEEMSEGVKLEGGTVTPLMNEIEVSCLPKNLPEKIEVDVIDLKLDEMLYLEDIVLPEGVEISLLTQEEPVNEPIVAVRLLRIAEEEIEPEADEETLEEGAEAEGEEGADGAATGQEGDPKDQSEEQSGES